MWVLKFHVWITRDFWDSGMFAALIIALANPTQIKRRLQVWGVRRLHSEEKVVYAAALSPVSSQASL